jgi:hypothetical protein
MAELTLLRRGDTPTWRVTWTNDDGSPFDLTGFVPRCTAKLNLSDADGDAVFQLTASPDIVIVSPPTLGLIDITPPHSATASLTADIVVILDVQITNAGPPLRNYTMPPRSVTIARDVTQTVS